MRLVFLRTHTPSTVNSELRPLKCKEESSRSVKLKSAGLPSYNTGKKNNPAEVAAAGSSNTGVAGPSGSPKFGPEETTGTPGSSGKKEKKGGVRIEFTTTDERNRFLEVCKDVQRHLVS